MKMLSECAVFQRKRQGDEYGGNLGGGEKLLEAGLSERVALGGDMERSPGDEGWAHTSPATLGLLTQWL